PPAAAAPPTAPQPVAEPVQTMRQAEPVAPATAPAAPAPPQPAPLPLAVVQPRFDAAYLDNPRPPYPSVSRRMGEEGEVRLRVQVDPAGMAQQVDIHQSSGFPRLDQAAQDTVRQWRFVPARQGDLPVAAWVIVPIQFTLRSQP
ncbi:MAG: energy transducer TonB, partial [Thiobacillus sp.]|nr:energy transducer TonB [Thiobacillus sp.]